MSFTDVVPGTETERLLAAQEVQGEKIDRLTDAVNGLGKNVEWIIENVQGIFQMFGSPQMMAMLPAMMNGAMGAVPDLGEKS